MISISKEESIFIRNMIRNAYITVCSKRKREGGKTYYIPESAAYINALNEYRAKGGNGSGK